MRGLSGKLVVNELTTECVNPTTHTYLTT